MDDPWGFQGPFAGNLDESLRDSTVVLPFLPSVFSSRISLPHGTEREERQKQSWRQKGIQLSWLLQEPECEKQGKHSSLNDDQDPSLKFLAITLASEP